MKETIHRSNLEAPWFAVSRALAQADISPEALGVLIYLLSKPPHWVIQTKEVETHFKIGRDQRRRIFQEAERLGYVQREQVRGLDGQYDTIWHVYDSPELVTPIETAYWKPVTGNQ